MLSFCLPCTRDTRALAEETIKKYLQQHGINEDRVIVTPGQVMIGEEGLKTLIKLIY